MPNPFKTSPAEPLSLPLPLGLFIQQSVQRSRRTRSSAIIHYVWLFGLFSELSQIGCFIHLSICIVFCKIVVSTDVDRLLMKFRFQLENLVSGFLFFAQSPDFVMKLPASYL